jgi:hypothetical protein
MTRGRRDIEGEQPEDVVDPSQLVELPDEVDVRLAELESRERDLLNREEEFAAYRAEMEARLAPRERTNESRSRGHDDSKQMERVEYYAPASQLEVPVDPDWHYRWVVEYVNGSHVPSMAQKRIREGYARVSIDALPEDFLVDEDRFADGWARQSGLILMRWPKSHQRARTRYNQNLSQSRLSAVNELQGVAGRDAVHEDRGTRALTGAEAGRALATMSKH